MYLVLSGIVISICIAWTYFLCYIIISLKRTPSLRQLAIRRDPYTENFETVESSLPKISIIIPARNEEKYIEECLDGLLRQTYQNFEIIVVDDGSSDRTAQLLQRYGMKDARIKIQMVGRERLGRVIKVISIQPVTFYSLLTRILLIPIVLFRCHFSIFFLTS